MTDQLLVFLVILAFLFLSSLLFIFYDTLYEILIGLSRHMRFSRWLYHYARENDYILINRVKLPLTTDRFFVIDHLLFGDKFIYVIGSKSYLGWVSGTFDDAKWLVKDETTMDLIDNPLKLNHRRSVWLSQMLAVEESRFVNLLILAKTGVVDKIPSSSPRDVALHEKDLHKVLSLFEKSPQVTPMKDTEIEIMASKINQWRKK